ncbi:MAG: vancomycin high temperature exclusion protein [Sedimentisphaeraceae bacterium JB056]
MFIPQFIRRKIKSVITLVIFAIIIAVVAPLCVYKTVTSATQSKLFDDTKDVPHNKVGLLLGTCKYVQDGRLNLYFLHRVNAAAELYKQGKIEHILVSGDNSRKGYNEPKDMRQALIERGVPQEDITCDFAGFRTLDSIVRAKEIFCLDEITIISQEFHNSRAVYIAEHNGIKAIAFNANNVTDNDKKLKMFARESFARCKMFADLYITNKSPKFLGKKEPII